MKKAEAVKADLTSQIGVLESARTAMDKERTQLEAKVEKLK